MYLEHFLDLRTPEHERLIETVPELASHIVEARAWLLITVLVRDDLGLGSGLSPALTGRRRPDQG